ncbi:hypothetical protein LF817_17235 [Halobacillus sp. A1]|uniref:hypothetical protein n=1 Tax=Halobacillus sp. A1 TaxID=2880262 RepID=UPI0020A648CA|nr:hypothetical protein [Halobacillus sp. A1]MCP3033071.1 hypothetical protein [Halobacillus sp. A1]
MQGLVSMHHFYLCQHVGFGNQYVYYDQGGTSLGKCEGNRYKKKTLLSKVFNLLGFHTLHSHFYSVVEETGDVILYIEKGEGIKSDFQTFDSDRHSLHTFKKTFQLDQPQVHIMDEQGKKAGALKGDLQGYEIELINEHRDPIMKVSKKRLPSNVKDLSSAGDTYEVTIKEDVDPKMRLSLLAFPVFYDILFFRENHVPGS